MVAATLEQDPRVRLRKTTGYGMGLKLSHRNFKRMQAMKHNDIGANSEYAEEPLTFEEVGNLSGDTVLEFGAPWCGHCQAAQPAISAVVSENSGLRHIKIYDGKGKPLGRAFKVKLWPTLLLVRDGQEVARVIRPKNAADVRQLMSGNR